MHELSRAEWQHWVECMGEGQHAEAWRGIACVLRWLAIRESEGIPPPGRVDALEIDMAHSGLLRRLIEGKEPYDVAPPESYGQPWYDLIESGEASNLEVCEVAWDAGRSVVINQAVWTVLARQSDEEMLVTYHAGGQCFRLRRAEDAWEIRRVS